MIGRFRYPIRIVQAAVAIRRAEQARAAGVVAQPSGATRVSQPSQNAFRRPPYQSQKACLKHKILMGVLGLTLIALVGVGCVAFPAAFLPFGSALGLSKVTLISIGSASFFLAILTPIPILIIKGSHSPAQIAPAPQGAVPAPAPAPPRASAVAIPQPPAPPRAAPPPPPPRRAVPVAVPARAPTDRYNLGRFIKAQNSRRLGGASTYDQALRELRAGDKQSHWIWFIFPQIVVLGHSSTDAQYSIKSLAEAQAYLANDTLRGRLEECTDAILAHPDGGRYGTDHILHDDSCKLHACMTLFWIASGKDPTSRYKQVLDKFYRGEEHDGTNTNLFHRRS